MTKAGIINNIDTISQQYLTNLKIPCAQIATILGNEQASFCTGVISSQKPQPISLDSPFILGSGSKLFTALAVLQLNQEGHIELDAPVSNYLPGFHFRKPINSDQVRIIDLLTFSGGFYDDIITIGCIANLFEQFSYSTAVEKVLIEIQYLEKQVKSGKIFSANNVGWILLGIILEKVCGQRYRDIVQHRIIQPYGLESTFLGEVTSPATPIQGHLLKDDNYIPISGFRKPEIMIPNSAIYSSIKDLQKILHTLLKGFQEGDPNNQIVKTMFRPYVPIGNAMESSAILWETYTLNSHRIYKKVGLSDGIICAFYVVPEFNFAQLYCMSHSASTGKYIDPLFKQCICLLTKEKLPDNKPKEYKISKDYLEELTGTYQSPKSEVCIYHKSGSIFMKHDNLPFRYANTNPHLKLFPYEKDKFLILEDSELKGVPVDFIRSEGKRIDLVRAEFLLHKKVSGSTIVK